MTLRAIRNGLRALFRRREVDQELDDEIAHYIEQATRENIRAGMSRADAARAARARLGSVTSVHQEALSGRWEAGIEKTVNDVGYGMRALRRHPGFTTAAVLTIALGIGANTAMFSVVNAVMFRPLPWHDADKLALIWTDDVARGLPREATAYSTITDWKSSNRTFTDIAFYSTQRVALISRDPSGGRGRSRSALVSENLYGLLGVNPAMGRTIHQVDIAERAPVAVISYSFWQRWFAGAPDVGRIAGHLSRGASGDGSVRQARRAVVFPGHAARAKHLRAHAHVERRHVPRRVPVGGEGHARDDVKQVLPITHLEDLRLTSAGHEDKGTPAEPEDSKPDRLADVVFTQERSNLAVVHLHDRRRWRRWTL